MRMAFLALLLLLPFSIAYAELSPFPYEKFVPENMSYSAENFTHQNATHQVILVQGQIYAILSPKPGGKYQLEPISELGGIRAALYSYYLAQGYSPDDIQGLAKAHASLDIIEDDRDSGEAKCRTLLGTDRNTCDSFEHCLQACYSVTSFCQPVALGAGRQFVEAMWSFENDTLLLDKAYDYEEALFDNISKNATYESISEYMRAIEMINRRATKASVSPLFDGYSYCFAPDYALPALTNIQLLAQKSHLNFSRFFEIGAKAENVRNLTIYGIKKMEYLSAQESVVIESAENSSVNVSISGRDSELLERYNSLNVSKAIFSIGPYNQSVSHRAEPQNATQSAEPQLHVNLETLVLASVVTIAALAGALFLFFKFRESRDRL